MGQIFSSFSKKEKDLVDRNWSIGTARSGQDFQERQSVAPQKQSYVPYYVSERNASYENRNISNKSEFTRTTSNLVDLNHSSSKVFLTVWKSIGSTYRLSSDSHFLGCKPTISTC